MATTTTNISPEAASTQALVPSVSESAMHDIENRAAIRNEIESRIALAAVQLEIRLPVQGMRVKDVLSLHKGEILETAWPSDEDLPGSCAGVHLFWTEFEVIEKRLAVRVTRLA